jgi:hypothetical protein
LLSESENKILQWENPMKEIKEIYCPEHKKIMPCEIIEKLSIIDETTRGPLTQKCKCTVCKHEFDITVAEVKNGNEPKI